MDRFIEKKRAALEDLCVQYQVERLELFGSATGKDFDSNTSDLDFLVEFISSSPQEHARCYFGLLEALPDLFERSIDLVETKAITNPYFIQSINQNRTLLYAA